MPFMSHNVSDRIIYRVNLIWWLGTMIETIHKLEELYKTSLLDYLIRRDEESLFQAYELSRMAVASGLGVMQIIQLHQQALISVLPSLPASIDIETTLQRSYDFFREILSPFEMVHRGFREASATVEDLTHSLQTERRALNNAIRAKEAEGALRKAEEKFRFLVEGTQAFLLSTDTRGRISFVNDAVARSLGSTSGELVGKFYLRFVAPEDRARVHKHFTTQLFLKREKTYIEFRYHGKSRRQGWVSFFVNPLFDRNKVVGLTGIGQDITQRKVTEEGLLRYSEIVESSDDAIIGKTLKGIITDWNNGAEKVFGYTPKEAIGKSIHLIIPPDRVAEEEEILSHIARGERINHFETVRIRKDGKLIDVSVTISPIKDGRGTIIGASKIARDITERKKMEEERARLLVRQSFLAKASSILISSLDYRATVKNLANLVTPAIADWCSVDLLDEHGSLERLSSSHGDPHKVEFFYDLERRSLRDSGDPQGLLTVLRAGKSKLYPEITDSFLETYARSTEHLQLMRELHLTSVMIVPMIARNQTFGIITFAQAESGRHYNQQDLAFAEELASRTALAIDNARLYSEAQHLNAELEHRVQQRTTQLQEANKELEAFSYSVAHDLRAPIRAIDGFTRVLLEDYAGYLNEEGKRFLNITRANTKRMGELIDDLLAFSRISRKELEGLSVINMKEMAQEIVDDLLKRESNCVALIHVGDLPLVKGSAPMLRQVFINLISNALKFTRNRPGPVIEIGSDQQEDEFIFHVKDNGVGFDMRYVHKLFGVFQRLHSTDNYEGTGVGLAIVQRIIHRHGGRVWAEGERNKGATFYFTLPRREDPA